MKFLTNLFLHIDLPKQNLLWNMLGGSWNAVLLIIVTPIYIAYIGLDGYGILGLWIMLLSLSGIFDMGIGASIVREFSINKNNSSYILDALRTFEVLIITVSIIFTVILLSISEKYSLNSNFFSAEEINHIIKLLIISVGFQYVVTIYSSGLVGYQKHFTLNTILILINTLRHTLGILSLAYAQDLILFFQIQILLSIIQVFITRAYLIRYIGKRSTKKVEFRLDIIKKIWRFSAGIAITSIGALIISNVDRIALAAFTDTTELGKYALAVTAAVILQMGIQPFYKSYYPRYSELIGNKKELRRVYFESCQIMASITIPIMIISLVMAPKIFKIWLGDYEETSIISFKLLVIGIGLSGLMWLPAALQHALGWTRLHASMIYLSIIVGIPILFLSFEVIGTPAAAYVWITHGIIEITLGLILMHMYVFKKDLFLWIYKVILIPTLISFPLIYLSNYFYIETISSFLGIIWILSTLLILFIFLIRYNFLSPIK